MSVNNKYYALKMCVTFYVVRNGLGFVHNTGQLSTGLLGKKSVFVTSDFIVCGWEDSGQKPMSMKYKMLFALKQNFYSQSYLFSYCLVPESE
jgi:hypothetical protein